MRAAGCCSSYQDECSKTLPAAPAANSAPDSAMMDVDKHQSYTDVDRTYLNASKQFSTGPAADNTQLLDPSDFTVYRPRARRLSEHGCGCCGLGLTLSDSPITETPAELQAAWAAMPLIKQLSEVTSTPRDPVAALHLQQTAAATTAATAAPPVTADVNAEVHAEPSAEKTCRFTSPFAGLTLSIPDDDQQQQQQLQAKLEQQPSAKHSSGSLSDAAAAALSNCQIVDNDGTPVPVFAIVSISFTKPANPAAVI